MSIKETPRQSAKHVPVNQTEFLAPTGSTPPTVAGKMLAVTRIALGLLFAWAFVDKVFGLGYATPSKGAWINGGSPTKGFLGGLKHGPFQSMFTSWAGQGWADWLFMIGLAGIAVALIFGVGLRIAAVSGTFLLVLMWAAEWTLDKHTSTGELTRSTNPLIDDHIIYAILLITLALLYAGNTWGFGKRWAKLPIVARNPWLI
jgi:thiosulfate dehydrogenase [quinone] large subunit